MEVILLENHSKLGNLGDVVSVKGGYARNYLLPNNMAVRATSENRAYFEKQKSVLEKEQQKKYSEAEKLKDQINGKDIVLIRQASDDGKLYGSVNSSNLAHAILSSYGLEVSKSNIVLNDQVKYTGKYSVQVIFTSSVSAKVNLIVARSEEEAQLIINDKFNSNGSRKVVKEQDDSYLAVDLNESEIITESNE